MSRISDSLLPQWSPTKWAEREKGEAGRQGHTPVPELRPHRGTVEGEWANERMDGWMQIEMSMTMKWRPCVSDSERPKV